MVDDQTNDQGGIGSKGSDAGTGDGGGEQPNVERDTDGRGSENRSTDQPMDPNVEAVTEAFEGRGASGQPSAADDLDGLDAVDLEDMSGGSRREPGR